MKRSILILLMIIFFTPQVSAQSAIKSPEEVFGFKMGDDRKLIDWTQIVNYFKSVDAQSERVQVTELGQSTLGKPFLLTIISSEETMKSLARQQQIQREIARPYKLERADAERLVKEGKTVVLITLNIHSTEIAASQESVELVYEFATANSPQVRKILDNVIILIIPSLNPDGQQLVVDWYKKTVGTPAEGSSPPELYHHYAGHDNNRDWFMYNLVESRHTARVLYHDWFPEIVFDQHQMGANGPRLFLPPYSDPVNPNVHPMLSAQVNLLGKFMVADLHRRGFKGVATGTVFNAYFEGTMSKTPLWHNRIGILSEMASALIATPVYFPRGSLSGLGLELPENKQQTNFLDPWPGGWWRVRDIIDYEKAVTYSLLDFAATFREQVKLNFYDLNREAIAAGQNRAPYGFVVPADQHNPSAATEMINRLIISGVDVRRTTEAIKIGERKIEAGAYYISCAQPARAYIKDLLEVQQYPGLKQYPGGPPRVPYDVTAWTLPMQMGVETLALNEPVNVLGNPIDKATVAGGLPANARYYLIERRYNNAFGLVNALLKEQVQVLEATQSFVREGQQLPAGTFVVPAEKLDRALMERLAVQWQLPVLAAEALPPATREVKRARIGIYQPWLTSMDEGWTRLVLDQYKYDYKALHNEDFINAARLRENFDVIIMPDLSPNLIVEGKDIPENGKVEKDEEPIVGTPQLPKQYQGGIGKVGVEAVKEFVKAGGTLIALGGAINFAIDKLRLPVINELKTATSNDFFAPGTILEVNIDSRQPLAYGMPERSHIYYVNNGAMRLLPYIRESKSIAYYGENSPLSSGWMQGEERLIGKTALAEVPLENGRVILYGFRVQHRAQTHGTFKLFLNGLYRMR